MDKVEFPDLNTDQARRMALLAQLLEHCDEPEIALELAERMECFVLHGAPPGKTQQTLTDLARGLGRVVVTDGRIAIEAAAKPEGEARAATPPTVGRHGRGSRKRRWTAEEDEKLRTLAAQDLSLEKIAAELDRTAISVRERARARQIRVKPRKRGRRPARADDSGTSGPSQVSGANGRTNGFNTGFGQRGRRCKALRNAVASDHKRDAELVERYLTERGATRTEASIETVVKFMRTRDYSIVRADDGRFVVDERDLLTPSELLERANSLRSHLGQPCFPKELAH